MQTHGGICVLPPSPTSSSIFPAQPLNTVRFFQLLAQWPQTLSQILSETPMFSAHCLRHLLKIYSICSLDASASSMLGVLNDNQSSVILVINTKNCSLSTVLTATDQKPQKSLKSWYYPPSHCLNVNVMLSNMTFLMIFAVFDPSPLTLWINCSF